jgi:hypothetical protein
MPRTCAAHDAVLLKIALTEKSVFWMLVYQQEDA